MTKRLFDIISSFLGLIVLLPLLIIIGLIIKIDSKGPVFYRGVRVGKNEKLFKIFKFRTMVPNAEKLGGPSTAENDPRATRVGKLLRKYKFDELPQLINVLKGEMSIVGPRPQVEKYVALYSQDEKIILTIKPGMTDYASIKLINLDEILGNKDVDKRYKEVIEPEKNKLRVEYAKHNSIFIDFKIIIKTFLALLKIVFSGKK
ncbi:MAG: sugar transferase [bacterium]